MVTGVVSLDGGGLSAAQRRTLGLKVDLNSISEEELARLPGIGRLLAKDLVEARNRLQRFRSWEEVDAVRGVGPVKLKRLQEQTEIRPE
jgi:competence protein ComEA